VSAAAISWARGLPVRGPAKAVVNALATFHNAKTGECRPGLNALAAAAGVARSTAAVALDGLCEGGFVTWTKGSDARGQRATNIYTLHMVSEKPKVRLTDSGREKPKVRTVDFGDGIPKSGSRTRISKKDKRAATKRKILEDGETPTPAPALAGCGSCGDVAKPLMNEAQVETLRPETLQPARVASEGETPLQEPSFHSEGATEKKGARPAFEALPPRHPTPAQIDAAIADAWTRFEALDDPRDPEAWG